MQLEDLKTLASQMLVLSTVDLPASQVQLLRRTYERLRTEDPEPVQVEMIGSIFRSWLP